MLIDWTDEYQGWRDRISKAASEGDRVAIERHRLADLELDKLQELKHEPDENSVSMMRVRQSGKFPLWRLSHPYVKNIAVRTIVWFPSDDEIVLVAIGGDKGQMGDVFYDSIGSRADQAIEKYLKERRNEK